MSERFVVISGCSGGGKSSLLTALQVLGHHTVEEPGRRVVKDELARGGQALPWVDPAAFARRAIELALADRERARARSGWVFFDRGLIDAASALEHFTGEPVLEALGAMHRYHRRVFMAPPWREIYVTDPERPQGFEVGLSEYHRLENAYKALGHELIMLPKDTISARAELVLSTLST